MTAQETTPGPPAGAPSRGAPPADQADSDSDGQYFEKTPPGPSAGAPLRSAPPAGWADSGGDGQYFEKTPRAGSQRRWADVNLGDLRLRLVTDRGVFSHGKLDAGTKLLLLEAPPLAAQDRRVLDLGCGWGPIACVAALRAPHAQVIAVDVNERALALTAENAAAASAGNVTVARPEDVEAGMCFDRILCNPPIRVGKAALRELLAAWLGRLEPDGAAHLVVHRHLGSDSLARWLAERGHGVTRLLSRAGYRILEVTTP